MKSYKLFLDDIRNPTDCTNYSTMFMPQIGVVFMKVIGL
jgi:hypothetical protein